MIDHRRIALLTLVRVSRTFFQTGAALLVVDATIFDQPWETILTTSLLAALASLLTNVLDYLRDAEAYLAASEVVGEHAVGTQEAVDAGILLGVQPATDEERAEIEAQLDGQVD